MKVLNKLYLNLKVKQKQKQKHMAYNFPDLHQTHFYY